MFVRIRKANGHRSMEDGTRVIKIEELNGETLKCTASRTGHKSYLG